MSAGVETPPYLTTWLLGKVSLKEGWHLVLGSSLALSLALGKFLKKIALGLVASVFMDDMYMVLNYCSVLKKRLDMRRSMVLAALAASKVAKKKTWRFWKKISHISHVPRYYLPPGRNVDSSFLLRKIWAFGGHQNWYVACNSCKDVIYQLN